MAGLRSRLRREWRLHPLTPGQLARRTLEFLLWGRRVALWGGRRARCRWSALYQVRLVLCAGPMYYSARRGHIVIISVDCCQGVTLQRANLGRHKTSVQTGVNKPDQSRSSAGAGVW